MTPSLIENKSLGHSENSEEAEESRKSGYNISWTCQGREERRKERGEKGRKKGREKGGEERGEEGRKKGREEGGEKIIETILDYHLVLSNFSLFFLFFLFILFCIFSHIQKQL